MLPALPRTSVTPDGSSSGGKGSGSNLASSAMAGEGGRRPRQASVAFHDDPSTSGGRDGRQDHSRPGSKDSRPGSKERRPGSKGKASPKMMRGNRTPTMAERRLLLAQAQRQSSADMHSLEEAELAAKEARAVEARELLETKLAEQKQKRAEMAARAKFMGLRLGGNASVVEDRNIASPNPSESSMLGGVEKLTAKLSGKGKGSPGSSDRKRGTASFWNSSSSSGSDNPGVPGPEAYRPAVPSKEPIISGRQSADPTLAMASERLMWASTKPPPEKTKQDVMWTATAQMSKELKSRNISKTQITPDNLHPFELPTGRVLLDVLRIMCVRKATRRRLREVIELDSTEEILVNTFWCAFIILVKTKQVEVLELLKDKLAMVFVPFILNQATMDMDRHFFELFQYALACGCCNLFHLSFPASRPHFTTSFHDSIYSAVNLLFTGFDIVPDVHARVRKRIFLGKQAIVTAYEMADVISLSAHAIAKRRRASMRQSSSSNLMLLDPRESKGKKDRSQQATAIYKAVSRGFHDRNYEAITDLVHSHFFNNNLQMKSQFELAMMEEEDNLKNVLGHAVKKDRGAASNSNNSNNSKSSSDMTTGGGSGTPTKGGDGSDDKDGGTTPVGEVESSEQHMIDLDKALEMSMNQSTANVIKQNTSSAQLSSLEGEEEDIQNLISKDEMEAAGNLAEIRRAAATIARNKVERLERHSIRVSSNSPLVERYMLIIEAFDRYKAEGDKQTPITTADDDKLFRRHIPRWKKQKELFSRHEKISTTAGTEKQTRDTNLRKELTKLSHAMQSIMTESGPRKSRVGLYSMSVVDAQRSKKTKNHHD